MRQTLLVCLIIIVTGVALYWPARSYDFVYLDEEYLVLRRQAYLENSANISDAFFRSASYPALLSNFYRPILTLSLMADAGRGGIDPAPYHTTNVILHILAAVLVFVLAMELGFSKILAAFFAIVFTAHPLLVQTVAWVPGRNDLLLAIFAMASIYFFLRRSHPVLHIAAFALAMFTKEVAIVIPLLCPVFQWARPEPRRPRRWRLIGVGWAVVLITWFLFRHAALADVQPPPFDISLLIRTAVPAIVLYVGKMLIPIQLSVVPFLPDTSFWPSVVGAALVGIALIFGIDRSNRRLAVAGLLWIFLWLGPVLISVESGSRTVFFEHRAYLPLFGFLLIVFIVLRRLLARLKPATAYGVFAVAVIVLGTVTYFRMPVFRNGEAFWRSAINSSPNLSRAHDGLAVILSRSGKYDEALAEHLRAIELGPEDKRLHNNLAATYGRMGRLHDAERALLQEIAVNPRFTGAYKNLVELYMAQGLGQKAGAVLSRAEELSLPLEEIK